MPSLGLHELVDEAAIYETFSPYGALKTVRLSKTKHGVSLKLATIEYHTERHAELAVAALSSGLQIQGHPCVVKRSGDALRDSTKRHEKPKVEKPAAADQHADSGFVWDEKSGYWYHTASGYYYDSTTKRYYDSSSGQWYQVDASGNYIPIVDTNAAVAAAAASAVEAAQTSDLVQGNQTAKDMTKWLKKTKKQQAAYEAEIIERDRVRAVEEKAKKEAEKAKKEEEKRALEEQAAATGDLSFLDVIG